ncbi:39S ribosomal protein L51, mitochondrial [Naganishia albida]|nr:39S ribosomal protein L51, mitochondrial [Naganishia albida]
MFNAFASSSRTAGRSLHTSAVASASSSSARSVSVPGYNNYVPPLRKLIVDYHPEAPAQRGLREYIRSPLVKLAQENPEVEILVRKVKQGRAAVLRGHYVNGRDKVICVNKMEANEIANKVQLLLDSSGAKLKHLKNLQVQAGPGAESARGIWSGLHVPEESAYKI